MALTDRVHSLNCWVVKRLAILGSTGSIGTQTLAVAAAHPDRLRVTALAARSNADLLARQAAEFGVARLALFDEPAAARAGVPGGLQAIVDLATDPEVDVVVVAVAGVIGLAPTLGAIRAGKTIALASKEVLVAAGEVVMPLARRNGVAILPIDSEHSAIFQCLQGAGSGTVGRLILTASGGPFRGRRAEDLAAITTEQALAHPTWQMGGKITIDSATLMNKGLETIEARWLFDVPAERVDVIVHPQSVIHSMVEFTDGSVIAQLGWPDMRLPIQVALTHPERPPSSLPRWDPLATPHLSFEPVDHETFPAIRVALESLRVGGTAPCAMNAANEEAANAFLRGEIGFLAITEVVREVLDRHVPEPAELDALLAVDAWARETARAAWSK
jgi:1-deoxy-D-xylulose-5-phosphate reductoisomerase